MEEPVASLQPCRATLARSGISPTLARDRPKPTDQAGDQQAAILVGIQLPRGPRRGLHGGHGGAGWAEPLLERLQPRSEHAVAYLSDHCVLIRFVAVGPRHPL